VARSIKQAVIAVILVGDTVDMVEVGFDSTREVTLDHMSYLVEVVRRGAKQTRFIGDFPYLANKDSEIALAIAQRLIAAGADSIKLAERSSVLFHCPNLSFYGAVSQSHPRLRSSKLVKQ